MAGSTVDPARIGDAKRREETISPRLRMVFVERFRAKA
jgi:hypothetical protein